MNFFAGNCMSILDFFLRWMNKKAVNLIDF